MESYENEMCVTNQSGMTYVTGDSQRAAAERGFSLIELMIALVVVSVLVSIALPAYQDSIRKSRRADAQGILLDIAQREQQWFIDNRRFAASLEDLGVTIPSDTARFYEFSLALDAGPPPDYTVTATPIGSQSSDVTLSINRAGQKLPADKW